MGMVGEGRGTERASVCVCGGVGGGCGCVFREVGCTLLYVPAFVASMR